MGKKIFPVILLSLLGFLLCFPQEALIAAKDGLQLWLNALLPTLLPFMILTSILIHTDMIARILHPAAPFFKAAFGLSPEGSYAFLLGLLCGYPMGAKISADLYSSGKIKRQEAEYLLTFCNNPSPAFLITYVGKICLNNQVKTGKILIPLFLSNMICMLFFRIFYLRKSKQICRSRKFKNNVGKIHSELQKEKLPEESKDNRYLKNWMELLDDSIMNGFETITRLGGYILLFSIISACFRHFWHFPGIWEFIILGILELTTGLHALSGSDLTAQMKFFLAMIMSSFGGLCILAQTKSVLGRNLSLRPYAFAKCLNAVITASFVFIMLF